MIRRLDVKLLVTLLVALLVPLGLSLYLVGTAVRSSLNLALNPELVAQMERWVAVQRESLAALRDRAEARVDHLADSRAIDRLALAGDEEALSRHLMGALEAEPLLAAVRLTGPGLADLEVRGPEPAGRIKRIVVERPVSLGTYDLLTAEIALDQRLLDAYRQAGETLATYQALHRSPPAYLERRFVLAYVILHGVTVLVAIVLGVFWLRVLVRRIHKLAKATAEVGGGDLSVRVAPGPRDEVGELVESFNRMLTELGDSRARIEYLQKISAWQEMARRLAHEIKNPLTPIHLAAQELREKYRGDDPRFKRLLEQSTEIIEEEVATLRRLTADFSAFARLPEVCAEPVDVAEFLEDCAGSLAHLNEPGRLELEWRPPAAPLAVPMDRMLMKRVVDNLVRNAAQALEAGSAPGGRIVISVARVPGRAEAEIRVADNGPGIQPEHHASIFDPYFTTKSEGTGLGLAICKKIILEHGGRIRLDEAGGGATFVVTLPLTPQHPRQGHP